MSTNPFYSQQPAQPLPDLSYYGGRNNPFDVMRNQQRVPAIPGKLIQSEQDIRPNDVPMDGSVALFPTQDMSCIFGKAWTTNGQIITVRYVPEQQLTQADTQTQVDPLQIINTRLDGIEEAIKKLISTEEVVLEVETPKKGGAKK